jgi:hypothetical protein
MDLNFSGGLLTTKVNMEISMDRKIGFLTTFKAIAAVMVV